MNKMPRTLTLTDTLHNHVDRGYVVCVNSFREQVMHIESSNTDVSAGFLFYKHGKYKSLYVVELWELVVRKGTRGRGTAFMRSVCRLADKYNITLIITLARGGSYGGPIWKKTSSRSRLAAFYRRFGFVMNSNSKDKRTFGLPSTMHRLPLWKES